MLPYFEGGGMLKAKGNQGGVKDHLTHRLLLFQIGHCFHQGPNTAQMNAKVTSCHCLKRMAQLVLQVSLKAILNIIKVPARY